MAATAVCMPIARSSSGRRLLLAHLAAILVAGMTIRGIEGLFRRDAALPGKGERVSSASDDFIAGQQTFENFDRSIVLCAEFHRCFHECSLQLEIPHINEALSHIPLHCFPR